ncbi:MAG: hypothetical protein H6719_32720 [Sandaracinaceae bacterium]|nr:hypothetical protein [Sandaracinaceae bacterium]
MSSRWLAVLCALSMALGCDGDPETDAGVDLDAGSMDAATSDPDAGTDGGPPATDVCAELGLATTPFDATATGTAWEEKAGDFTVQTLDGPWTLSEEWSGCESYVFVAYAANDYGRGIWSTSPDPIFTDGPRNVHYFFTTWEATEPEAMARVMEMRQNVEDGFDFVGLPEADRAFWRTHVHYVTSPVRMIDGSVGDLVRASEYILNAFAVTREQRLDPVGSLMTVGAGGFRPDLGMARFFSPFYDYLYDLDARVAAETDATVVDVLRDETTTLRTLDRLVTLPDAAAMGGFDTLEVDVELTCTADPSNCSEWDRIAYVFFCEDEACATTRELVRWITPYSRPGRRRWVMDATPFLGLLRAGGPQTFRAVFGPDWEAATERTVSVSLRFSSRGEPDAATGAELAFRGGNFDASYNDAHTPFAFTPPADASRVELVVIVSGHGQEAGNNCAEWCDHHHTFDVGTTEVADITFTGMAGRENGCAELAGQGVPPGQWGNWSPLRAGWCPGLPVETRRFDITSAVTLGAENQLSYAGSYGGGAPSGGNIDLSAYVVYYR